MSAVDPAKRTIALDVDDTLANLRDPIAAMISRELAVDVDWRHWTDYVIHERFKLPLARFLTLLIEHEVLEHIALEPDARDSVEQLRAMGYRIEAWTARQFHPRAREITAHTLAPLGIGANDIVLFGQGESKATLLAERADVAFLVDDNAGHLAATGHGASDRTVLMDRPWNRGVAARRVHCMADVPILAEELR
ncbi:hypothetical protein J7355_15555 [Endozoicomonas sp. G2_2]|uniref:hypothetical protein n=1 Tax=Endozoicomonas sp. G2_2 TaxID=2821092 RepID=UPI001ADCCE18|nr:hypothetical protein [Endozoicomonas sp. G2_2]MBO9471505.1 hypothetical protein [Endozoicomonas sp. G2_2]